MTGSIFDYDAIGERLKELRPDPYLKPSEPPGEKPLETFGLCYSCPRWTEHACSTTGCYKQKYGLVGWT